MRQLRDKCANLYLPRQIKDNNTKKVNIATISIIQLPLSSQQLKKPATNVRPDFFQMCNLEVPSEYEDKYRALLTKHKNVFSLSKSDLGFCDIVLHIATLLAMMIGTSPG